MVIFVILGFNRHDHVCDVTGRGYSVIMERAGSRAKSLTLPLLVGGIRQWLVLASPQKKGHV
jgi:hypothetical protein